MIICPLMRTRYLGIWRLLGMPPFARDIHIIKRAEKKMSSCRHVYLSGRSHSHRCKHCGKRELEHALENRRICPKCGIEVSRTGLYPHLKYHCKANPARKKRKYSTKACPICKRHVHSASYARHIKTHSKKKKRV